MKRFVRSAIPPLCLLTAVTLAPAGASEPPASGVQMVLQVLEDGEPVRGLTAADFEVREEGRSAVIAEVSEIDLGAATAAEALPQAARRQVLLFFDLMGTVSLERARAAARDLALHGFHPTDLVGVFAHRGSEGPGMLLAPTSDRHRLVELLATLGSRGEAGPRDGRPQSGPIVNADYLAAARNRDSEPEQGIVQQEQGRVLKLIRALSALALPLRDVPAPAQVVLFSEGFDSSVILGHDGTRDFDRASDVAVSQAVLSGEPWRVESSIRYGSGVVETELFEMLSEYRRLGARIQAVQVGGGETERTGGRGDQGPEGLLIMAEKTGGELFRAPGGLAGAMAAALEPEVVAYLVTFEPRKAGVKGRYRRIEVSLKNPADGVSLIYRPGYYEPRR